MKRVFWKIPAILAVFGLALGMAGCPTEPETPTNGPAARAIELVTISVTGIPAGYQNQRAELGLHHLTSGRWAAGCWRGNQVESASASFSFGAFPDTYSVELRLGGWPGSLYSIPSRNITLGSNTIPFSAFIPLEQVSITVTGIPDRYIGSGSNQISGGMSMMRPGTFAWQGSSSATISGASATFTTSIVPGSYDVHLRFRDHNWNIIRYYSAPSRNIAAGTNTVPFSYFAVVEPITVTLTEIPSRYINDADVVAVDMVLNTPGLFDWIADSDWVEPESSSVAFTLFAPPGIYTVALSIEGVYDSWVYSAPARNIAAGTNAIPFSAFTTPPSISITVTGIPSEYIGREKDIILAFPNTNVRVADGRIYPITGASATIDFFRRFDGWGFNTAGTYGVYLRLWSENGTTEYFIPSRHLNVGSNTIPFSAFTRVAPDASSSVRGFTENAMPAGPHVGQSVNRTMPGRFGARTHPLTDR